ncbi:MAG: Tol-Pal system protein TolB, partial [Pseudomonadota bacterium]|nr:Tol-Pal system protein TolB [Pseudomonadota bacterium]
MIKIIMLKMVVVIAVLAAQISVSFAQDLLRIDITQGNVDPLPIAINSFQGQDDQASMIGADIANVVKSDLNRSGLFQSINPAGFIERDLRVNARP